jgi:hypothetical protein
VGQVVKLIEMSPEELASPMGDGPFVSDEIDEDEDDDA